MSNGSAATALITTLDDDAWEDLLSFIEERRVIPIVGPELLLVTTDRGPRLLLDWVAEKLAGRLNVNTAELPQPYTLNDVVCWFLSARGRREEAYVRMLENAINEERLNGAPSTDVLSYAPNRVTDLPAEMRGLHDVRLWRDFISAAERGT